MDQITMCKVEKYHMTPQFPSDLLAILKYNK